jgi:uncharacterized membrane protein YfcA
LIAIPAGAVNSVAGGGTLLTFPVMLYGCGMLPREANATNTVGLLPAAFMGARGFDTGVGGRANLKGMWKFYAISMLGGGVGSVLLRLTSNDSFKAIVPWLILMAAVIFLFTDIINKYLLKMRAHDTAIDPKHESQFQPNSKVLVFQFFVAVYGGYFGAGIGIMMLAALSLMRAGDIYRMNFLKNLGAFVINAVASLVFIALRLVDWPIALSMALGSTLGGWGGAGIAKKIGPRWARRIVSLVGIAMSIWMMIEHFRNK